MKPIHSIPPLIAASAALLWLVPQRRELATLEKQNEILTTRIAAHSSGTPASSAELIAGRHDSHLKGRVDWKKTAADFTEMFRSPARSDIRSLLRFQQRMATMAPAEILSALEEINSLDLSQNVRNTLERELFSALAEKDPQLLLSRFIDQIHDPNGNACGALPKAIKIWAETDRVAAIGWFDQQVAAGKFDGKALHDRMSHARMEFEGILIGALLSPDPDAAARRLGAVPVNERQQLLSRQVSSLSEENHMAFATLVRSQLPQKEQAKALTGPIPHLSSQGGYSQVAAYLDRIEATPAERATAVEIAATAKAGSLSSARKVTLNDIDDMRKWGATQAPGTVDQATGKALAQAAWDGKKTSFAEAAELAVHYQEIDNNDVVLGIFLESASAYFNKEQARELVEKIVDPARREKILKNLR